MKLHELKIKHEYLVEIVMGRKTFEFKKKTIEITKWVI